MSSDWPLLTLGDVCEKITDGAHNSPKSVLVGKPMASVKDLTRFGVDLSNARLIAADEFEKLVNQGCQPQIGDVLIAKDGNSALDTVCTVDAPLDAVLLSSVAILRPNKAKLDSDFLKYYFCSPIVIEYLKNNFISGAAIPRVVLKDFRKAQIKLPPIKIQKNISKILRSIDDKIELNTKTNQTLEQIAQAIFKSWFVDFDPVKAKIETLAAGGSSVEAELAAMSVISAKTVNELNSLKASNPDAFNKLAQSAMLFPAAMQDSEIGGIPEGWEVKQLSEICQVINGRAYKNIEFKTEGTPIVRIQNLSNGGKTVYSDLKLPPEKYIEREDFIYAWSATFGPHIWRGPKSIYHYHIWKMEVDESVISRYFLYLSMFRKTEAMKNAGTGSIFTHLTKKLMESQQVLVGDQAINKKFSDIIVPIFDQISSLKEESSYLADIRDTLLPKLLTGDNLTSEVKNV